MKSNLTIMLLTLGSLCLLSTCTVNRSEYNASSDEEVTASAKPPEVNSALVQGGMVVYDEEGHGLIAATTDIGKMEWPDAMKACDELVLNGYDDWRLPNKDELNALFTKLKLHNAGNFESSSYWSSSEYNNYYAWRQNFSGGRTDRRGNKEKKNYVRPVRNF